GDPPGRDAPPPAGGVRPASAAPAPAGGDPGAVGGRLAPARAARLAGHAAVILTLAAAVAHAGILVTRGVAAGRLPWGNMYEFAVAITFVGVVGWLATLARWPRLRQLGLFVALADVLLLGAAGLIAYTDVKPLVPALQSTWYVVHVSTIIVASGLLMLGVVPAVMFLIRDGWEQGRTSFPYHLGRRVPAAAELERLTFQLHAFAFPVWTFGVAAGAIWAEAAWGRYWGWDPKEIWAFISWVVYAGYLHARATPYVRRRTAAWIAVLAFGTMLMNLWGVNLFFGGLHSYADMG
ncbi:MAG TPA: c-type cytochrome biogenesis protein CcsB, partial [Pilimelia sp.]|nr:c-type cytochrome biogenesis protein CcsB [Pilimelia sp.]